MAAAALAVELPHSRFQLTVVPADIGESGLNPVGSVEACDPSIRRFHAKLGLADSALVRGAGSSFSLGVAYAGWSRRRPAYFSPFGDIGAAIDGVQFHQLIARMRKEGGEARPGDYSLATLLAQAGRFCHPSDDPASPLSTFSYGLHVEREAYVAILIDIARRHGAEVVGGNLKSVELDHRGQIEALVLNDHVRLAVDFVVDASAEGKAIGALDSDWVSWRDILPCDRSAHAIRSADTPPAPYSLVEAHPAGWIRTVPSQGLVGDTFIYSSSLLDRAGAEQVIAARASPATPIHHTQFEPGRRRAPWYRNCVALGAACWALEPLYPLRTALIQSSIERLIRLFPAGTTADIEAREFNRETTDELDRARDFALLRYVINDRVGDAFWDKARSIAAPPELTRKMAAYRSRGTIPMIDGDLFDEADWALIFDEHDVRPARHDVLADAMPAERLAQMLSRMRQMLIATAAAQPLHGEYLAKLRQRAAA